MKTLNLFGLVYSSPDCINLAAVSEFLNSLEQGEEFTVYINSPGGDVFEGLSIYNLLSEYQSNMTIKIIGEATSIASVIAMSGGEGKVFIAETALMLIHKPWTFAIIDEDYIAKLSKSLNTIKQSIIIAYKRKTGMDEDTIDQLMTEADYRNAEECVTLKLADSVYVPSESETKTIEKSNAIKNEILKKYMFMNLIKNETEQNQFFINNGGNRMFKTIDEAVVEVGKLQNQLSGLDSQLNALKENESKLNAAIQAKDAELSEMKNQAKETAAKAESLEKINAELTADKYKNEAKLFCEQMFNEKKLTRAEVEPKITKLLALRNVKEELYNLEVEEIKARPTEAINSLTDNLNFAQDNQSGNSDSLLNSVNEFNKRRF